MRSPFTKRADRGNADIHKLVSIFKPFLFARTLPMESSRGLLLQGIRKCSRQLEMGNTSCLVYEFGQPRTAHNTGKCNQEARLRTTLALKQSKTPAGSGLPRSSLLLHAGLHLPLHLECHPADGLQLLTTWFGFCSGEGVATASCTFLYL